jgi:hypothetical protein
MMVSVRMSLDACLLIILKLLKINYAKDLEHMIQHNLPNQLQLQLKIEAM